MQYVNPWKEASALIIVAPKQNNDDGCDYNVVTVRGNPSSAYLSSSFIFPGGQVEAADYSSHWWPVFDNLSIKESDFLKLTTTASVARPPIIAESLTLEQCRRQSGEESDFLDADIALRIAAIRETFVKTGLLLARQAKTVEQWVSCAPTTELKNAKVSTNEEIAASTETVELYSEKLFPWRERIDKKPLAFVDMCLENKLCPDIWSLHEWWNWLTPVSVGRNIRYDTIFYLAVIQSSCAQLTRESAIFIDTPRLMLTQHRTGKFLMAPAQFYELSRLLNFTKSNQLREFAQRRGALGIERWLPVVCIYADGAFSLLPSDELYPANPDLIAKKPVRCYPQSLAEMRVKCTRFNRIEIRAPTCQAFCNINLNCGHVNPVTFDVDNNSSTGATASLVNKL